MDTIEQAIEDIRAGRFVIVVENYAGESELYAAAWTWCIVCTYH